MFLRYGSSSIVIDNKFLFQVLNFYSLQDKNTHIKTVPVMDELESVLILDASDSAALLGSSFTGGVAGRKRARDGDGNAVELVVITGGLKGVLRLSKITYNVCTLSFADFMDAT